MAMQQLQAMTDEKGERKFSLDTLRYLLSNCTYGGRMEDEMDMLTLETFFKTICRPELCTENSNQLDPDGIYHTNNLIWCDGIQLQFIRI